MDSRIKVALGVCAVGAGVGIACYLYDKRSKTASDIVELDLQVDQTHITWLDEVAAKYTSGDSVKALHKLVDYCKTSSADDAGAEAIFKKVRCNTCGGKQKVSFIAKLTPEHVEFIDASMAKHEITGGQDKTLRVMFEYAINETEQDEVFGS